MRFDCIPFIYHALGFEGSHSRVASLKKIQHAFITDILAKLAVQLVKQHAVLRIFFPKLAVQFVKRESETIRSYVTYPRRCLLFTRIRDGVPSVPMPLPSPPPLFDHE